MTVYVLIYNDGSAPLVFYSREAAEQYVKDEWEESSHSFSITKCEVLS